MRVLSDICVCVLCLDRCVFCPVLGVLCSDTYIIYVFCSDVGVLQYEPREGWGAAPPKGPMEQLSKPVPIVAIFHTADLAVCEDHQTCCNDVQYIQKIHMKRM